MAARKSRGGVLLPTPPYFDSAQARDWNYEPNEDEVKAAARLWREEHHLAPSFKDDVRVTVLAIDFNRDFVFPKGRLYVGGRSGTGAMDDTARAARLIYGNLGVISEIIPTMDTHFPWQIFFSEFLVDRDGNNPPAHSDIPTELIANGTYRPDPDIVQWLLKIADPNDLPSAYTWLYNQTLHYARELERKGRYAWHMWPEHCLLGGTGHPLAGVIQAARLFHSWARRAPGRIEIKGVHMLTEYYAVTGPEVLTCFDGTPLAQNNTEFMSHLLDSDMLVIIGEADSHCVAWSIDGILKEIAARDPKLARKVYVVTDCMSAVVVRDAQGKIVFDYTPQAEEAHARFAEAGMHLITDSTIPMTDWPDSPLK